jgi:UDP-N-acetylmuramate--alanine ligase
MTNFDIHSADLKLVHFIGIGGVSMSGLASILLNRGVAVSGSDMGDSAILDELKSRGATISKGHGADNIKSPDLVIYTDAISPENPEYLEALRKDVPTMDRGTFLGQLMKQYKNSIAVSGTHGKTSTTGMLSVMLGKSELNPTILLGGYVAQLNGNIQIGDTELLITEACEYKRNLLKFHSTIGLVLNIDADHLDYYKNLDEIVDTFGEFASLIPVDGHLVINSDDPSSEKVINSASCKIVTFGVDSDADYRASDIVYHDDGTTSYTLNIDGVGAYKIELGVLGLHNVYNSLGALASSHLTGVSLDYLIEKLKEFKGTQRRLQTKGVYNGFTIIDDYAHHPTEVKATLSAVKNLGPNRVWCIFQPHTYTRTQSLLEDFSMSFFDADKVIVTNIYAAREKDTGLIHSKNLVERLSEKTSDAIFIDSFEEVESYIVENASPGDIVITMGAGDVYKIGESILEKIK